MADDSTLRARKRFSEHFLNLYGKSLADFDKEGEEILQKASKKKEPQSPYNLSSFFWLVASAAVFYYTDFAIAIQVDPRINRYWFNIGVVLIGVNVFIGIYFVVVCSWIRKISSDDWEKHFPFAIPFATACFALGSLCLNVGLWPLWKLLTPVILFILFMGFVVFVSLLPSFC
ncbi:transmembrane protein 128-like [Saccoglossus kowalevskii]